MLFLKESTDTVGPEVVLLVPLEQLYCSIRIIHLTIDIFIILTIPYTVEGYGQNLKISKCDNHEKVLLLKIILKK